MQRLTGGEKVQLTTITNSTTVSTNTSSNATWIFTESKPVSKWTLGGWFKQLPSMSRMSNMASWNPKMKFTGKKCTFALEFTSPPNNQVGP